MKKLLIILCLFSYFISCRKIDNSIKFPTETQSGLNTFACYIDNVAFIAKTTFYGNVKPISVTHTTDTAHFYEEGFLSIQGIDARFLDISGNVSIQKLKVFGIGEYSLAHDFNCADRYNCNAGSYYNKKEGKSYFIESGKLTITKIDTVNRIISGRFYFTGKDTLGNRKEVKNGVFDTHYIK